MVWCLFSTVSIGYSLFFLPPLFICRLLVPQQIWCHSILALEDRLIRVQNPLYNFFPMFHSVGNKPMLHCVGKKTKATYSNQIIHVNKVLYLKIRARKLYPSSTGDLSL